MTTPQAGIDTIGWKVITRDGGLLYRAPDGTSYREMRRDPLFTPDAVITYAFTANETWLRRLGPREAQTWGTK